jgi:hypothetical protein
VLLPIVYPTGVLIGSAVVHVMLALFGGANRPFSSTVRALAYTAPPQLLALIPVVGQGAAGLWVLVLEIIGVARVHRTSYGKSAGAVLAPALCACACLLIAIGVFGVVLAKLILSP